MKRFIRRILDQLGYELRGTRYIPRQLRDQSSLRPLEFDDVICRLMVETKPSLSFIQVGAFDGELRDPLRKYIEKFEWTGVLLEPQASAAARLRALYTGNSRVHVREAAIESQKGTRTLYSVAGEGIPDWAGGLASFNKDTILSHAGQIPNIAGCIREQLVDCVRFDEVLELLPNGQADVLQIDTEGADGYILSLFPFDRVRPSVVHWEVKHLTVAEREACLERLGSFGYRFAPSGGEDMMGLRI